jgi:hypothetical protein
LLINGYEREGAEARKANRQKLIIGFNLDDKLELRNGAQKRVQQED